jgi:hypothetical protein
MGSSKLLHQEIQMYYLVNLGHNGMAAHLPEMIAGRGGVLVCGTKALTVKMETVTMTRKGRI